MWDNMNSKERFALLAAALACAMVYLPAFRGGFPWDDLRLYSGLSEIRPPLEYILGLKRPMADAAMTLGSLVSGFHPVFFHLLSLVLHLLNAALVYVLGRQLFDRRRPALAAALLFALHPLCTEAVSWVAGLGPQIMTACLLGSFALYVQYRRGEGWPALIASALIMLLGAMAGQGVLLLPVYVLLYEAAWGRDKPFVPVVAAIGVYGAMALLYALSFGGPGELAPPGAMGLGSLPVAAYALGFNLRLALAPVGLNMLHEVPVRAEYYLILGPALLGLAAFVYTEGRRREAALLGMFVLAAVPPALLALSGVSYPIAERLLYPSVGFFGLALASAFGPLLSGARPRVAVSVLAVVLCAFGGLSIQRTLLWADTTALWEDAAAKAPETSITHIHLAAALVRDGRVAEAEEAIMAALARDDIRDSDFLLLMKLFAETGAEDRDQALIDAIASVRDKARAYYGIGYYYYNLAKANPGKGFYINKAALYLGNAVAEAPDYVDPHYYLALTYITMKDVSRAEVHLRRARELDYDGRYRKSLDSLLEAFEAARRRGATGPAGLPLPLKKIMEQGQSGTSGGG
jgi:tetratricopeptide (TPR) repeat protein